MTILGASGFIGSAVMSILAERPIRLRAVARGEVRAPAGARAEVEPVQVDITDPAQLAAAVAGSDAVLHLVAYIAGDGAWRAGEGTDARSRTNVGSVHALIDALADDGGRPTVVFAGSTSQVGLSDRVRIDGTEPDDPRTEYDRQKLEGENALKDATARGVLRGITLRLATVYGIGPDPGALGRGIVLAMARRALAGEPLTMWHDGSVERDLVHVTDVARAFVAALDNADALAGGHWLIGGGESRPLKDIFGVIAQAVSAETGQPPVPVLSVPAPDYANATDFHGVDVDASAFRAATGWSPRVSLEDGLRGAVAAVAGRRESGRREPGPLESGRRE
ncbi:NAD-dependent epimerase/dehydratase family protein [Saccharothrix deserti]|uniref:NAD-dependent epimerase/dehydratase family protein n=1 Tax=Saccharothrix deserti TaxID=2593674 RepID=UPI00236854B3|nr:NAD-dependent epimerase/dehydratase family protein [Saccharothrix deserti]